MCLSLLASFPEWKPHLSFLSDPAANELIALRWLHLLVGHRVHRGFVFRAMVEARDESEQVERAAEERRLDPQADQPDLAERLQPDLVEGRREVI